MTPYPAIAHTQKATFSFAIMTAYEVNGRINLNVPQVPFKLASYCRYERSRVPLSITAAQSKQATIYRIPTYCQLSNFDSLTKETRYRDLDDNPITKYDETMKISSINISKLEMPK